MASIDGYVREASRRWLKNFAWYINPKMEFLPFHDAYYHALDLFANGAIRRMIIQMPPQHGKSQGSSRLLPAFILGRNPDVKICIASYSTTIARDFNRDVQRIIDSPEYTELFPQTKIDGMDGAQRGYTRNADVTEICGHLGGVRAVGRGGSLTSKTVDIQILDDIYKDYAEGNSPVVRDSAWNWYTTVVRTRQHNHSQELIVFTRWHEDDLIGRLEKSEQVIDLNKWSDLDGIPRDAYVRINFEALKKSEANELDPREMGEALWEDRHSRDKLEAQMELDPVQFQCLYQGNPSSAEGRLYHSFKTYAEREQYGKYIRSGCYIDVADEGSDFHCAVCYDIMRSDSTIYNESTRRFEPLIFALVTDIDMTDASAEVTEVTTPAMINRNSTQKVWVESNNGGSQYEKVIRKKIRAMTTPFAQRANKESRILTYSATVNGQIVFPFGWQERWPRAYEQLTSFLRDFGANRHDDLPDVLTGIAEKELSNDKPYGSGAVGVKIR